MSIIADIMAVLPSILGGIALALAALPMGLIFVNLGLYRRPGQKRTADTAACPPNVLSDSRFPAASPDSIGVSGFPEISVLIPARNEEGRIQAAIDSVRSSVGCDWELIIIDDQSQDGTAAIVQAAACKDARIRLMKAPPLPAGWIGKQHACHLLAAAATKPLLVFMDADVRLQPDSLARMAAFMETSGADLASGIPRQMTRTVSEQLLIPLIHFVLLGFLPFDRMRKTTDPRFAAGCGQLFIARAEAYSKCGGHGATPGAIQDGMSLPRTFRKAGLRTDLFDATDVASVRMYDNNADVWRGLVKNTREGLGAPARIVPFTVLLLGGQVLQFALAAMAVAEHHIQLGILAGMAVGCAWFPRFMMLRRFQQPFLGAFLHPVGVACLVGIQWAGLFGRASWKGRTYGE